jgi:hypothetical protein
MDDNERSVDLLNQTDSEDIWRLADDPRMTLFLGSGTLRYSRSPRCEVRRQLLESSASRDDDAYWIALANQVRTDHMPGERCPNSICPDDPYSQQHDDHA